MEENKGFCKICNKEYQNHYAGEIALIMEGRGVCFDCAFWIWQHSLDLKGNRDFAIINGAHYVLCPHTDINWPVGSCGRKYRVRFFDGRVVDCDNLWHQGQIPEHFRDIMPDNAEFVPAE